jgi:aspartate/methionine/tyrosine aminotransferase
MVRAWDRRRRLVADGLNAIMGITYTPAEGAFYAFPDIRGTGMSSMEFADRALTEAEVAVVPGNAFGDAGEGFVRMSFATSDEALGKMVDRLSTWLGTK